MRSYYSKESLNCSNSFGHLQYKIASCFWLKDVFYYFYFLDSDSKEDCEMNRKRCDPDWGNIFLFFENIFFKVKIWLSKTGKQGFLYFGKHLFYLSILLKTFVLLSYSIKQKSLKNSFLDSFLTMTITSKLNFHN